LHRAAEGHIAPRFLVRCGGRARCRPALRLRSRAMSEKRHRQQERRQRRKAQGRARPSTAHRPSPSRGGDAELEEMLAGADRLAATGLREPTWAADLAGAQPTAAALMHEAAFDDGVSVMVEFTAPNVETHTIGIYIDHNMGGLVKDVFLAGALSDVRSHMG